MVYPTSGVTVASDIPTYQHSYSDSEATTQTKYQYIIYLDDGITVVWDSGDIIGSTTSTVQPQGYLNNNTYYKIKAFATDGDGIQGYSTLVRFYTNWVISDVTPQFVAIADDTNARMQLKWSTLASIDGHYIATKQFEGVSEPTFSRSSIAYKQDGTQVAVGVPRYETGTYGQAIMIEEGTTNLLMNNQASVETDLTGLTGWSVNTSHTFTRDTTVFWQGSASAKLISNYAGAQQISISTSGTRSAVTAGLSYAFSARLRAQAAAGRQWKISVLWYDGAGANISQANSSLSSASSAFTELTLIATAPVGAVTCFVSADLVGALQNEILWYDGGQIEQKAYPSSWQLPGSARAAEVLTVPTAGVFTKSNWAVELVYVPKSTVATQCMLWSYQIDANNFIQLYVYNNLLYFLIKSGGTIYSTATVAVAIDSVYSIMISGNGSLMRLCVNDVQIGTDTAYVEPVGTLPTNMYIGSWVSGLQANGLISSFRVSSRARTLAEHQAAYNSGLPLPVDLDTTYKLNFNDDLTIGNTTSTYQPAILSNGVRLGLYGEKLYWVKTIPDTFTIINRYILKSSKINTLIYIYKDGSNYIRLFYDSVGQKFVCAKCIAGYVRTYGSSVIAVPLNTNLAYAIKQNSTGLFIYTQVSGVTEKWGDL